MDARPQPSGEEVGGFRTVRCVSEDGSRRAELAIVPFGSRKASVFRLPEFAIVSLVVLSKMVTIGAIADCCYPAVNLLTPPPRPKVLEVETVKLTPELRRRLPFLSYLPIHCDVSFLEVDMAGLVSEETARKFRDGGCRFWVSSAPLSV